MQIDDRNNHWVGITGRTRTRSSRLLQVDPLLDGAKVVAYVRYGGWLNAGEYLLSKRCIRTRYGRDEPFTVHTCSKTTKLNSCM